MNVGSDSVRNQPLVRLDGVTVDFGDAVALAPTTLEFHRRSSAALVGPNGSGKTTVLRLLAGLQRPSAGRVERDGTPSVTYVAQHQDQHRWMPLTVAEVLRMSRYRTLGAWRPARAADRSAVDAAAWRLGVDDLRDRLFGDLSGGQRQRVLMASAVASEADVVLLDEPVTGLDIPSQRRIMGVICEERDAGRLVVMSTHDLDEARECDRIVLLAGTVVADGIPEEVLTREHLTAAFGTHLLTDGDHPEVIDDHGHGTHRH